MRAIDRSSTSRPANADTVDISRPAIAPNTSIPNSQEGINTNEAELTPGGGVTVNGSLATPISPASDISISDSVPGVNGENVDPLAQLAREAVEARYAEEEGDSAEGRAIYQDQAVDVVGIDKAGGGKVSVKLADGRSVDATALEYEDSGEAELWRVIGSMPRMQIPPGHCCRSTAMVILMPISMPVASRKRFSSVS